MEERVSDRLTVHVIAAPQDDEVTTGLVRHLRMLRVGVTDARQIPVGVDEREALLDLVNAADAILLVVSANLHEWPFSAPLIDRALARHTEHTPVIPLIGRACVWDEAPYASLQPLPRDREPIARDDGIREEALANVARAVHGLLARAGRAAPLCPFPGLELFDEDGEADFFGREAEIDDALTKLGDAGRPLRWLQIDGPSGSGKSSFARAGLIPAVRRGALRRTGSGPDWAVAVMRPGHDPIANLAEALLHPAKGGRSAPVSTSGLSLDAVTRALRESTSALASVLRQGRPDGYGVLLLVDQFEEAFTQAHADVAVVKQFDALLAGALDDRDGPLLLVTTIRSDFAAHMGNVPLLERRLSTQAARYYLGPMSEAGLARAIEQPAERAGLMLEAGLVPRILEDARAPGALPLVAHLLQALYERRQGLTLTAAAYVELGGVGGALAKRADATMNALDVSARTRAKALLLRLVKLGRGSEDTRLTARRSEAIAAAGSGEEAERVLMKLSGERAIHHGGASEATVRLVVVSGEEGRGQRVDLVHEALIRRWEALRGWIKEARQALELRDDIEQAARIWETSMKDEGALPKGTTLARFLSAERAGLTEQARSFLDAAEEAEKRAQNEKRRLEEEERNRNFGIGRRRQIVSITMLPIIWIGWTAYLFRRGDMTVSPSDIAGPVPLLAIGGISAAYLVVRRHLPTEISRKAFALLVLPAVGWTANHFFAFVLDGSMPITFLVDLLILALVLAAGAITLVPQQRWLIVPIPPFALAILAWPHLSAPIFAASILIEFIGALFVWRRLVKT